MMAAIKKRLGGWDRVLGTTLLQFGLCILDRRRYMLAGSMQATTTSQTLANLTYFQRLRAVLQKQCQAIVTLSPPKSAPYLPASTGCPSCCWSLGCLFQNIVIFARSTASHQLPFPETMKFSRFANTHFFWPSSATPQSGFL